ncbi:MAG: glycosyltransferase family 2 protein, partial [Brachybacterium paraconglomeratum]|nr:glycosyltransferase family 2 protein [Brachybacterium paraconglomeratum]
ALDYDVVIPTHGRRFDLLLEAIDSVDSQPLLPRAVIVVVDGVPEVATRLRHARPEVRAVCLDVPQGEAAARQRGIEESTADWVCFLDDDDLWSTRKQEIMAEYVAGHPDCRALCAGFWTFASTTERVEGINGQTIELRGESLAELEALATTAPPRNDLDYLDIHGDSLACLLEYNRGNIGTAMVRREVLEKVPAAPAGLRPGADHLLFCAVARHTEWHLVRQRLMFYRLHGGQDTRTGDPAGARNILRARTLAWEWVDGEARRLLGDYGATYRRDLRRFLWPLLRSRQWSEARRTYQAARPLLPRRRDRALALVPEPIVWRVRYRLFQQDRRTMAPRSPSW